MRKLFLIISVCCLAAIAAAAQWDTLEYQSPLNWSKLDSEKKLELVKGLIGRLKENNIILRKDPRFYAAQIDANQKQNPRLFNRPVGIQLNIIAIQNGDYDNGQDSLELIREVFGDTYTNMYVKDNLQEKYIDSYEKWREENKKQSNMIQ